MTVALGIRRNTGETWRECAIRYGRKWGLQHEIAAAYELAIAAGETEEQAAWDAVYEWDCCDLVRVDDAGQANGNNGHDEAEGS